MDSLPYTLADAKQANKELHDQIERLKNRHASELLRAQLMLRDQFAMAALPGLLTLYVRRRGSITPEATAQWAYFIADAMLKAREADAPKAVPA